MKVHFYQIYFKEREEQYEENFVEYFFEHNIYGKRGCYGRKVQFTRDYTG